MILFHLRSWIVVIKCRRNFKIRRYLEEIGSSPSFPSHTPIPPVRKTPEPEDSFFHITLEDLLTHDILSFLPSSTTYRRPGHISWAAFTCTELSRKCVSESRGWVVLAVQEGLDYQRALLWIWLVGSDAAGQHWPGQKNVLSLPASSQHSPQNVPCWQRLWG